MINPVKSFLTHGPLILKEIYTINKYINIYIYCIYIYKCTNIYNKSHSFFFFLQNTSCIRKRQIISHQIRPWFRAGKFRPGIAFTICRNEFHLPENGREGLKLVSKMALKSFEEMEHEFPFGIFHPEKQDYLFRCSDAAGNFRLGRPKQSCSIYFPTGFAGNFL